MPKVFACIDNTKGNLKKAKLVNEIMLQLMQYGYQTDRQAYNLSLKQKWTRRQRIF